MAFSDNAVLEGVTPQERLSEGQIWAPIPVETPVTPITKELEGIQVPELGVSPTPQEMEEPTEELVPAEVSMEEMAPWRSPLRN